MTAESREQLKRSQASLFSYDAGMERIARLQSERPDAYDTLSPSLKTQLAYYCLQKDAARELGQDVSGGAK
ncbi:hypothetical protein [Streptomyces sp. SYSU K21746]